MYSLSNQIVQKRYSIKPVRCPIRWSAVNFENLFPISRIGKEKKLFHCRRFHHFHRLYLFFIPEGVIDIQDHRHIANDDMANESACRCNVWTENDTHTLTYTQTTKDENRKDGKLEGDEGNRN